MAEAGSGAPASNGAGSPTGAAPAFKVVPKPNAGKMSMWDLENSAEDEPLEQIPDYIAEKEEDKANHNKAVVPKAKPKTEPKPEPKPKAKVEPVEEPEEDESEDEDDSTDADLEDDEDEAEVKPIKPRKKSALDLTNDDPYSDEDDETVEATSEALDPNDAEPEDLEQKYKVSIKDGDKTVDKEYSLKQLIDMAQKNESGDLKLYQAAEYYKKAENVVNRLQTEPFEVLKYIAEQTGQDYYNMIEKEMADQFRLQKLMTPEQRAEFLQAEQDKKDLNRYRTEQADLQKKLEQENLTKQQQKIANDFVSAVGDVIEGDEYLKHVYDNLDEGDDKNYIIKKFGSWISQVLLMKQIPAGQVNHLPAAYDASPKNPQIINLVISEIKKEAEAAIKAAPKAAKLLKREQAPEEVVNAAGTKVRAKVPGVKAKVSNVVKGSKQDKAAKKAKKQSVYDFLRESVY